MEATRDGVILAGCDEAYLADLDRALAEFARLHLAAEDVPPGFDHPQCQVAGWRLLDKLVVASDVGPGLFASFWERVARKMWKWNSPPAYFWGAMRHIRILMRNGKHQPAPRVGIACGALTKYALAPDPADFPRLWRELRRELRDYLEFVGRPLVDTPTRPDWIGRHFTQKRAALLGLLTRVGWASQVDIYRELGYTGSATDADTLHRLVSRVNRGLTEHADSIGGQFEIVTEWRRGVCGRLLRPVPGSEADRDSVSL